MMLDASGGAPGSRGIAATNWNAYDVPGIWAIIGDYDESPQWTHVSGWRKTAELTAVHLSHLKAYRDRLAETWPPERNEASAVYLSHLDKLITSVQETYNAAVANQDTMAGATSAIMAAKHKLKPIYDQWQYNAAIMAEYEAQATAVRSGTPAPIPGPPPLPPNWRESLNNQARTVMNDLSAELALAAVKVVVPPSYMPPRVAIDDYMPPRVVVDIVNDAGEAGTSSIAGPSTVIVPPVVPRPAPVPPPPPSGSVGESSPILSGSPPTTPLTPPAPSVSPPPASPNTTPGIIGAIPGVPTTPASTPRLPPSAIADTVRTGLPTEPKTSYGSVSPHESATSKPLSSGAVIGATPGNTVSAQNRAIPAGGVIGARPNSVPTTPTSHTTSTHITARPGKNPARRQDDYANRSNTHWDPDNPWVTAEGVSPVVTPEREPRHYDPGPAIGRESA